MSECPELIRKFRIEDLDAVVAVWHRAGRDAYVYLPAWQNFSLEQAGHVFSEDILPKCELWVGVKARSIVAFLGLHGSYIDRLYVDPSCQRKGWGTALINFAKRRYPEGVELCTHQANRGARRLYERLGFVAVRFGLSPPPENVSDVEYHWRPNDRAVGLTKALQRTEPARHFAAPSFRV